MSLFGSMAPATSGANQLFGATGNSASQFGTAGAGQFGATGTTSLFGATTTSQQSNVGTGLFGTTGGGQQSNTGTSLFGAPAGGQQANTGTGLFGATGGGQQSNTGTGLFGATAGGQQSNTGTGLFGTTAGQQSNTGTGLFGTPGASQQSNTGTGLFGNIGASQQSSTGTGMFGTTPTSQFGGTGASQLSTTGIGLFGNTGATQFASPGIGGTGLFGDSSKPGGYWSVLPKPTTASGSVFLPANPTVADLTALSSDFGEAIKTVHLWLAKNDNLSLELDVKYGELSRKAQQTSKALESKQHDTRTVSQKVADLSDEVERLTPAVQRMQRVYQGILRNFEMSIGLECNDKTFLSSSASAIATATWCSSQCPVPPFPERQLLIEDLRTRRRATEVILANVCKSLDSVEHDMKLGNTEKAQSMLGRLDAEAAHIDSLNEEVKSIHEALISIITTAGRRAPMPMTANVISTPTSIDKALRSAAGA